MRGRWLLRGTGETQPVYSIGGREPSVIVRRLFRIVPGLGIRRGSAADAGTRQADPDDAALTSDGALVVFSISFRKQHDSILQRCPADDSRQLLRR